MKRKLFPIIVKKDKDVYTAFSPNIKAVHFSSKNKQHAIDLAEDGIDAYIEIHPETPNVSDVTIVMV